MSNAPQYAKVEGFSVYWTLPPLYLLHRAESGGLVESLSLIGMNKTPFVQFSGPTTLPHSRYLTVEACANGICKTKDPVLVDHGGAAGSRYSGTVWVRSVQRRGLHF